jgi:DNA-binding NarL/FixJ family response regulator
VAGLGLAECVSRGQIDLLPLAVRYLVGHQRAEILAAWARGCMLKSGAVRSLMDTLNTLAKNKPELTSKISMMAQTGCLTPPCDSSRLTPREREIVQLVAEGRSSKEIADVLGISVKTAETHRTNILRKLNLRSASEMVRYAIRNKIVEA